MTADPHLLALGLPLVLRFMLGFARIGGAVMLMPGIGEAEIPARARLGLAAAITVLLFPLLPAVPAGLAPVALAARIAAELAAGIWLGLMARLMALALPSAGQILSFQVGLSSVVLPDATLGGESTLFSTFFGLLAAVLVLGTPLFALPLRALVASYRVLPPGGGFGGEGAMAVAVALTARSFALGVQLAGPFLLAGLVWQVGLGVMSRFVPHIQVSLVAMPAQVLGGLALLALLAIPLARMFEQGAAAGMGAVFGG